MPMKKNKKTCLYRYKHTKGNKELHYKLRENMGKEATDYD